MDLPHDASSMFSILWPKQPALVQGIRHVTNELTNTSYASVCGVGFHVARTLKAMILTCFNP